MIKTYLNYLKCPTHALLFVYYELWIKFNVQASNFTIQVNNLQLKVQVSSPSNNAQLRNMH